MAVLGLFCSWAFCSCCKVGLLLLQWAGFSLQWLLLCCGAQALGRQASIFVAHSFVVLWHVNPEPGIKPMSPALARGFLATRPPGLSNTLLVFLFLSPFLEGGWEMSVQVLCPFLNCLQELYIFWTLDTC